MTSANPITACLIRLILILPFCALAASVRRDASIRFLRAAAAVNWRSEEHTSELQSLMRISYAVFCLKKKINTKTLKVDIILTIFQTSLFYSTTYKNVHNITQLHILLFICNIN